MTDPFLQLEQVALNAWAPFQQIFFDGWVLRFADGYTKRANSANLCAPIETNPAALTEYVEAQYRARNQPPIFRIIDHPRARDVDEFLARRNYAILDRTLVMTCPLEQFHFQENRVQIRALDADTWLAHYTELTEIKSAPAAHRRILQNIVPTHWFAILEVGHLAAACGVGVLDRGYFGFFDIITARAARRQGHATQLLRGLAKCAQQNGAHTLYLQVVATNAPARQLYQKLGFTEAYTYWYRVAPNQ